MYVDTESVLLVRMVLRMVLISRTLGEDMCLAGWEGWVRGSRMVNDCRVVRVQNTGGS